jgi:hypothetical protein
LTETFSNRGLAPNWMVMLEATSMAAGGKDEANPTFYAAVPPAPSFTG